MEQSLVAAPPIRFETHPSRYVHWRLEVEAEVARLVMDVQEDRPLRSGYPLKTNSYDLGVDLELADALQRLRFEHPEVKTLVVTSGKDRIFCSGANIYMLGSSSHSFKVNFCKYTNETRLAIEDASQSSGLKSLAAVNGACAGGGYELALACDEILLVDDASSAVSLPEVSLLAVLPGTGGLTRVTDKRKVRRDLADVFSSLGEGVKGKRAVEWRLVDETVPLSRFAARVAERAKALAASVAAEAGAGRRPACPSTAATRTRAPSTASSACEGGRGRPHRRAHRAGTRCGRARHGRGNARAGQRPVGPPRFPRAGRRAPRPALQPPRDRRGRPQDPGRRGRGCWRADAALSSRTARTGS